MYSSRRAVVTCTTRERVERGDEVIIAPPRMSRSREIVTIVTDAPLAAQLFVGAVRDDERRILCGIKQGRRA